MSIVYLASASPRRRELLDQIGVGYRPLASNVDEQRRPDEVPQMYVLRLALDKARAGRALLVEEDERPVLGADTAVVLDGDIMGKPRDQAEAHAMLTRLSGRTHHVYTAVALVNREHELTRLSVSAVTFRTLEVAEIEEYWCTGEPADKAGAYAIQGRAAVFISRIEGSYSGVMGLPLFETAELLRAVGIDTFSV